MLLLWCRRLQAELLSQEADHGHSQGLWCFSNCWSSGSCFWETLGKIESNPQDSVQTEDHIELPCATISPIQLNASTLSDPHSLFIFLISPLILSQNHLNKIPFWALVDSGSTYYFIDSEFVDTHHLRTSTTPPVALCLFDGLSNSTISEIANLPIIFSTGDCMNLNFYITLLDSFCSLVLGYNWLTQHNLLIDWVNRLINFHPSLQENLAPSHIMANIPLVSLSFLDIPLQLSDSAVSISVSETSMSNSGWPNIAIINAAVFLCTLKLPGSGNFELCLALWTFRLILQNLQKLLIFLMFLPSIMNSPMFSAKLKLKSLLLIILMTSKSIWKKMVNLQLALYTLFWHLNKQFWRNSLRKISIQVSSD